MVDVDGRTDQMPRLRACAYGIPYVAAVHETLLPGTHAGTKGLVMRWKVGRNGIWIELGNGTEVYVGEGYSAQRLVQSHNDGIQELEDELKKHKSVRCISGCADKPPTARLCDVCYQRQ